MKRSIRPLGTALAGAAAALAVATPAQAMEVGQDAPNGVNQRVVLHLDDTEIAIVQQDLRYSGTYCHYTLELAPDFDWDAGDASSGLQRCADMVQEAAVFAKQANITTGMYAVYVNYPGPLGGWAVWRDGYTPVNPS